MFDLLRYRGPAVVAAGLLAALVSLDAGLTATIGYTGRFLPDGELPTDDLVFQVKGKQISGLLALPRPRGIGTGNPLGILLGQSTLGHGVDAPIVEEGDGRPLRWANLAGWGGSINRIREISELLSLSGIRPDVVMICTNPYMLIGHDFWVERRSRWGGGRKLIQPWIWTYDNRLLVNFLSRRVCHRIKLGLYRSFGFGFEALYPPSADPWQVAQRPERPPLSPGELAEQLEYDRALGWFDPGRYSAESSNARSLVELIRVWRGSGTKVCIVLLPEHSLFRRELPDRAVRCFDGINRANFPDDPVPIYNLGDRIPDHLFFDLDHPREDAVRAISTMVAECARDFLLSNPTLERLAVGGGTRPRG